MPNSSSFATNLECHGHYLSEKKSCRCVDGWTLYLFEWNSFWHIFMAHFPEHLWAIFLIPILQCPTTISIIIVLLMEIVYDRKTIEACYVVDFMPHSSLQTSSSPITFIKCCFAYKLPLIPYHIRFPHTKNFSFQSPHFMLHELSETNQLYDITSSTTFLFLSHFISCDAI